MKNTIYNYTDAIKSYMDPWSSGYDVSLTRRRSPVRLRVGPLLIALLALTGCASPVNTDITADLAQTTIASGANTTLSVTATNNGAKPVDGTIRVTAGGEDTITVTHPDPGLLDTTLYADESVTRVFTVSATTTTRRTDYELSISYANQTQNYSTASTVLSVTND